MGSDNDVSCNNEVRCDNGRCANDPGCDDSVYCGNHVILYTLPFV